MSYRDEVMALHPLSAHVRNKCAEIADRADARIAELERDGERTDAQWRQELRIYQESADARIAELEAALRGVVAQFDAPIKSGGAADLLRAVDVARKAIDAARAGGGESGDGG